jgi:hypothetical protein
MANSKSAPSQSIALHAGASSDYRADMSMSARSSEKKCYYLTHGSSSESTAEDSTSKSPFSKKISQGSLLGLVIAKQLPVLILPFLVVQTFRSLRLRKTQRLSRPGSHERRRDTYHAQHI